MYTSTHDIDRIGRGLCERSLPKSEWSHAAHIAAAVWLLMERGDAAFTEMPGLIQAYNEATGVENTDTSGYHHTITIASLKAVRAQMGEGSSLERTHRVLSCGLDCPDWLFRHYSRAPLFSVTARRYWVEPDLAPLPD